MQKQLQDATQKAPEASDDVAVATGAPQLSAGAVCPLSKLQLLLERVAALEATSKTAVI